MTGLCSNHGERLLKIWLKCWLKGEGVANVQGHLHRLAWLKFHREQRRESRALELVTSSRCFLSSELLLVGASKASPGRPAACDPQGP